MTSDETRAWILCYEWRDQRRNVLCRGVHPLAWLASAGANDPDLVLLWYAECSPDHVGPLRACTCVEIVEPAKTLASAR